MKTILKTFAAIGFGLVALIASMSAIVIFMGAQTDWAASGTIGLVCAACGALVGWNRVQ